jgi:hypothetical protein
MKLMALVLLSSVLLFMFFKKGLSYLALIAIRTEVNTGSYVILKGNNVGRWL